MKARWTFVILMAFLLSCQDDSDELHGYNTLTDTFVLVDYHGGVYKFVQINNEYTIGIEDGLMDIPQGFSEFASEETCTYYKVSLKVTGIKNDNATVKYQRYTEGSSYNKVKRESEYSQINCAVQRLPLYNDYMYYLIY